MVKPFRVRLHVRMVRAAVERNIERQAETFSTSSLCEVLEVLHRPKFRIDIIMSAVLVSHGIDAIQGLFDIYMVGDAYAAQMSQIVNVDPKWGVPDNKYALFTPITNAVNPYVVYRSNEVIPGVHYKLELNFAPETRFENTDSTANYFLPTLVRVIDVNNKNAVLVKSQEIPATQLTSLVIDDFSTTNMECDLKIETRVSSTQLNKNQYNRIMRIAKMRLTPVLND